MAPSQNEANFRELSHKQEYLKSHKSVIVREQKLEDMLNDFLSARSISLPESWYMEQRAKELEAKNKRESRREAKRKG